MIWLALLVIVSTLGYAYIKRCHSYWENRGVEGPKPHLIFGSVGETLMKKKHIGIVYDDVYRKYPNERYVGLYSMWKPILLIRDPDLAKNILLNNFSSFHDNAVYIEAESDPIFHRNPFALPGESWKTIRAQISPMFTVAKMKTMFPHMVKVSEEMCTYLENNSEAKSPDGINAKILSEKFAINVVTSAAFGLEGEAFKNPNSHYLEMAKKMFEPTWLHFDRFTIIFVVPFIHKILRLPLFNKDVNQWIIQVVQNAVKYRKENDIVVDDLIESMIQLRNKMVKSGTDFTDVDMAGNCMAFLLDGFETSSIVLTFALYEVAANDHVQESLRKQITDVLSENEDHLTYQVMMSMPYLEQVIMETVRKYPTLLLMLKMCTKTCTLPGEDEESPGLVVEKGTTVIIPTYGFHRDPMHYPEPERFIPERFSEIGYKTRHKYSFLGFGTGPRVCLGMRFGMAQIKTALAIVVKTFHLEVSPKTPPPLQVDHAEFLNAPKGGAYVIFKKIK